MIFVVLVFFFVVFMLVATLVGSTVNSLGFGVLVALIVVIAMFAKIIKD